MGLSEDRPYEGDARFETGDGDGDHDEEVVIAWVWASACARAWAWAAHSDSKLKIARDNVGAVGWPARFPREQCWYRALLIKHGALRNGATSYVGATVCELEQFQQSTYRCSRYRLHFCKGIFCISKKIHFSWSEKPNLFRRAFGAAGIFCSKISQNTYFCRFSCDSIHISVPRSRAYCC